MDQVCPNCNNKIKVNFCENCGQKKFKRIDKKYVWDEIQYTVFHTNKGLLYTVKKIIQNPGKTAKEFIDGNRVNHYKPILLVFVLSGISTFISFKILDLSKILGVYFADKNINSKFMGDLMTFLSSYTTVLMLVLVPFFALITKIAFRKWGHNYYEHIVMNAYILSYYTLFSILVVYPIIFIFRESNPINLFYITQYSLLAVPFILFIFFKGFYSEKPVISIIGRIGLIVLLTLLGYILLVVFASLVGIIIALIMGPEAMKYIKPS